MSTKHLAAQMAAQINEPTEIMASSQQPNYAQAPIHSLPDDILLLFFVKIKKLRLKSPHITTLTNIVGFVRLTFDTLQELEFSGKFYPLIDNGTRSPYHSQQSDKNVILWHLHKLTLSNITGDKDMFLILASFSLVRIPRLETLRLEQVRGGFRTVLEFLATHDREGLRYMKELVMKDTKTNGTTSDGLNHMLHHLAGLEVLSLDGFLYDDDDDEWLEALSWGNPQDKSDSVPIPTQYMTRPDLKRTICPHHRKLDLRRMKVDSRLLQAAVESRTKGGGGGSLREVSFDQLESTDENQGGAGLEWVPQELLDR